MIAICDAAELTEAGTGVRFDVIVDGGPASAFVVRYRGVVAGFLNRCSHVAMELDWLPLRGRFPEGLAPPLHITGLYLVDSLLTLRFDQFGKAFVHIILPAFTLSLAGLASIARFTRAGVLETMQKEFVHYAEAAGYQRRRIIWVYVLRNSVVGATTQIGLLFGGLISSAVAVESIFDWPGVGSFAVNAILTSDYKAVLAVTLVVGVIYAAVNILVDVVHAWLDPRVAETL